MIIKEGYCMYTSKIQARSCNHCCRGETILYRVARSRLTHFTV